MLFSPDNLFFTITLLLFAGVCFRDLKYGIYIIIFLMPAYLWRAEIFSIPTTLLELMIYVLFLMWLFKKTNHESRITNHESKLIFGIILLFLGVTISTAISTDIKTGAGIFKGWFVGPFLFFLVLINVIKTKKQIFHLFSVWALSGLAVAIISLFYLITGDLTYDDRLKAFFLSPNHLAMYLSPAFLVSLVFLLYGKKADIKKVSGIKYQVLSIIFLIIIFIPLYFTCSYGAFLGIAAAVFCLIILKRGIISKKLAVLCLLILLSLLFLSADKFQQIADPQNRSSFHSRLVIWNASKEILKDNYIFGIGLGTFQEVYLNYSDKFNEPYLEWAVPQPHNIFLAFWLQTGIMGLAGFILILVWFFNNIQIPLAPFYKGGRKFHNSQFTIPIILMIYFLIHGLIDTTYWKNDLSLAFWILIGVMVVNRNAQKLSAEK